MNIYIISTSPSLSVALKVCPCGPEACGVFNMIFTYFYQTILHMFVSFASLFYSPLLFLSTLTFLSRMHLFEFLWGFCFSWGKRCGPGNRRMVKHGEAVLWSAQTFECRGVEVHKSHWISWNISTLAHPVLHRDVPLTHCHSQLSILSWFQGLEAKLSFSAVCNLPNIYILAAKDKALLPLASLSKCQDLDVLGGDFKSKLFLSAQFP